MEATAAAPVAAQPQITPEALASAPQKPAPANGVDSRTPPPDKQADEFEEFVVNGKPRKLSREEQKKFTSLGLSAHEKFEQASHMSKRAKEIEAKAKQSPIEALRELGVSDDELRKHVESWYKEKFIDPETMTEEQRELHELRKYKESQAKREAEEKERTEKEEQSKLAATEREKLERDIVAALDTSGLPKSAYTVSRIAHFMRLNLQKGFDAPMDYIVDQVKEEQRGLMSQLLKDASPAQMIEILGSDMVKKLRQHDLEQLKSKFGAQTQIESVPSTKPTERRSMRDVEKYFNELRRSK